MLNKFTMLSAALCAILASGCATGPQTLTANSAPPILQAKPVQNQIVSTAANLNAAVTAGALPATDPAVQCANNAVAAAGLAPGATKPVTFTVTCSGGLSLDCGAVAYIKTQMAL